MTQPAGYSGTALPTKLGIKRSHRVLLLGAPEGFDLGPLPDEVTVRTRVSGPPYDVALVFCKDRATLVRRWPGVHAAVTPAGRLWVAWPKKAGGLATDLDEGAVREHGLGHGRVDVKVCAVDATWSGLAFVVRLRDR